MFYRLARKMEILIGNMKLPHFEYINFSEEFLGDI